MAETPIARDYLKSFYEALEKQININVSRARDIANFGTGFLGVTGGGSAYVLLKVTGWSLTQRILFTIASSSAFLSFFISVLLSFMFIRSHRRFKPFPGLPDTTRLMLPIDELTLHKFEEDLYKYYYNVRVKGLTKLRIYDVAFWFMMVGFVMYAVAAGLIMVFEWR